MNHVLLAAAALLAFPLVACAASSSEPTQSEGVSEYRARVSATEGARIAKDVSDGKPILTPTGICYPPQRHCDVSAPDSDGFVTVLAGCSCIDPLGCDFTPPP